MRLNEQTSVSASELVGSGTVSLPPATGERLSSLVEAQLLNEWIDDDSLLSTMCRHALRPPGKLVRSNLLLNAGIAVGGRYESLLPAAVAMEFGHAASLAHDDIIDGDQTRRNRPTVHAKFGVGNAILTGDALFFHMFECMTKTSDHGIPADRVVAAIRVAARLAVDLCRGQVLEDQLTSRRAFDLNAYLEVIRHKTAAFFAGACECGAVLGGGTPGQATTLAQYGQHLGMAFQIRDDLLPYVSDPSITGKAAATDLHNRRPTIPIILAHQHGSPETRRQLEHLFNTSLDRTPTTEDFSRVRDVVHETGAVDRAMRLADDQVQTARALLTERIPTSASRQWMDRLLTFVATRSV